MRFSVKGVFVAAVVLAAPSAFAADRSYEMYDPMGETQSSAPKIETTEGEKAPKTRLGKSVSRTKAVGGTVGGAIGGAAKKAAGAAYGTTVGRVRSSPEGVTAATRVRKRPAVAPHYVSGALVLNPELDFGYTTGSGPVTFDFNRDLGLEAAIGTRYKNLRFEGTWFWQNRKPDELMVLGTAIEPEGGIKSWGLLLGGYWEPMQERRLSPYLGGAAGVISTQFDISSFGVSLLDDDTFHMAWRGTLGASYDINERFEAFGETRYFGYGKHEISTTGSLLTEVEMNGWAYSGGLRYSF